MIISQNISLKSYNTFDIDVKAKHFISVNTIDELKYALSLKEYTKHFILGGGSNMLLTKDIDALVIHLNLKGIEIISTDPYSVNVKVSAGENWHQFVLWAIEHNFGGIENLSLIPGNVGTAPIQNIGAYGVELKDTFVECSVLEIATQSIKTFTNKECNFDYRSSIFKENVKGDFIILDVTFKLASKNHQLKTSYGAIKNELGLMGVDKNPTIKDISKAVITIRSSKLPDPKEIGNSGSFFKNPIISNTIFEALKINFPNIPSYPISKDLVKIPAGWLIEQAGFKGKRFNNYGVHKNQALVLVNYGGAKGKDIYELSLLIQNTIKRIYNINLEAEVNIF
ncbi:UDP-N-acetylmuramate dehydrogenase [Flavobacteriaceae bacterium AU392]|nr:UDP-N-acetylmuramate dehydrogenase [Flavobacteriaceae bacterium]RKM82906.1 UDP-N-acetylmuramate dehydrogenase [Flavobacteriaceae bacterium AU392]